MRARKVMGGLLKGGVRLIMNFIVLYCKVSVNIFISLSVSILFISGTPKQILKKGGGGLRGAFCGPFYSRSSNP